MHHTVILSDVHLWQAASHEGFWMRYRDRRFFPDAEIAGLLDHVCDGIDPGRLELVFNGDVFDFDVQPVERGRVVEQRPPRSDASARRRLEAILDDHPLFIGAVADMLARGQRVVFVSGNHDVQLCFASVRDELRSRILDAVERRAPEIARHEAAERIVFRQWFHRTRDGIHVEHGNQYDRYCSVRYPTEPLASDGAHVQPTMGSLVMRHLISRMGYFNPNVDSTFLLTTREYVQHWVRYYLFSTRSLALAWAFGSIRVAAGLVLNRERLDPERTARMIDAAALETGADRGALGEHARRFALPELQHAVKLLRLDRLAIWLALAATITLACLVGSAAVPSIVCAAAIACVSLARRRERQLHGVYDFIAAEAIAVARIHSARAIVFGHTHIAQGEWIDGVFVGNCGTWAPAYRDVACTTPVEDGKPFVWLRSDGDSMSGGLMRWRDGNVWLAEQAPIVRPPAVAVENGGVRLGPVSSPHRDVAVTSDLARREFHPESSVAAPSSRG